MADPSDTRKVAIIGVGGLARDAFWLLHSRNETGAAPAYQLLGFLSPAWSGSGEKVCGIPVLGPVDLLAGQQEANGVAAICALDDPAERKQVMTRLGRCGLAFVELVHASAVVSPLARLGNGAIVFPGATLSAETHAGAGVVIYPNASIGPGALVEDFATIGPGARVCGLAVIGEAALIGPNAVVTEGQQIPPGAHVGPGEVV